MKPPLGNSATLSPAGPGGHSPKLGAGSRPLWRASAEPPSLRGKWAQASASPWACSQGVRLALEAEGQTPKERGVHTSN